MKRRQIVVTALALPALGAQAQATPEQRGALQAAIARFTGGAVLQSGKVQLDIAPLVDNGNTVPVTLRVDHPTTGTNPVRAVALFSERNPSPEVLEVALSPFSGEAVVSSRIRLVTTQAMTAVAKLADGSCYAQTVHAIVTLAACLEPDEG
jgi:sulfur-oxidizing protein SoxY